LTASIQRMKLERPHAEEHRSAPEVHCDASRSMMPPGSGRPILRDARAHVSCVKHHGLLALLRTRAAQIPSSLRALPPAMAAMVAASRPSAEATWPIGS